MRAMRHRKGIIDENVAERRELRNEIRIVLFLAHMKPSVFQAYDVARVYSGDRCRCFFPYASSAKATGRFRTSAIAGANSLSDCLGSCPLGRPKWESKMTLPPLSTNSMIVGAIRSIRV